MYINRKRQVFPVVFEHKKRTNRSAIKKVSLLLVVCRVVRRKRAQLEHNLFALNSEASLICKFRFRLLLLNFELFKLNLLLFTNIHCSRVEEKGVRPDWDEERMNGPSCQKLTACSTSTPLFVPNAMTLYVYYYTIYIH